MIWKYAVRECEAACDDVCFMSGSGDAVVCDRCGNAVDLYGALCRIPAGA